MRRGAWAYRLAKNEGGTTGFGSTDDMHRLGALGFVNYPFPVPRGGTPDEPTLMLRERYAREPFEAHSIVNVSGIRFGANSAPAMRSLSHRMRGLLFSICRHIGLDTGPRRAPAAL